MGGLQLYAGVVPSTHALAVIDDIDSSEALKVDPRLLCTLAMKRLCPHRLHFLA